jgi:HlyD family secretion protein
MNAPTLFVIAADLTKMQVLANIDEADVGRMRPGQNVTFRVDAFPNDTFSGAVQQVRLQPAVVQNVVTYSTVIAVPNPDLKLKPGMTANVNIEIARRSNVLRIPNAALRFRPTNEMFAALNQPVPQEMQRGAGSGFGRGRGQGQGQGQTPSTPSTSPGQAGPGSGPAAQGQNAQREPRAGSPEARGGGDQAANQQQRFGGRGDSGGRGFDPNMTPEERQRRREEMLKNMSPEQRERFEARMRERDSQRGGANQSAGSRSGAQPQASRTLTSGATTIDSLFGPLPTVETRGAAWLYVNKQLKMVRLRLGITDGTYTEVLNEEELQPNMEVVTMMTTGLETRTTPGQGGGQNPLMGPQRGGRGPGGGGGGGGRGRG